MPEEDGVGERVVVRVLVRLRLMGFLDSHHADTPSILSLSHRGQPYIRVTEKSHGSAKFMSVMLPNMKLMRLTQAVTMETQALLLQSVISTFCERMKHARLFSSRQEISFEMAFLLIVVIVGNYDGASVNGRKKNQISFLHRFFSKTEEFFIIFSAVFGKT